MSSVQRDYLDREGLGDLRFRHVVEPGMADPDASPLDDRV